MQIQAIVNINSYSPPYSFTAQYSILCTGILHFISLCFITLFRYCVFYKLKVCSDPASSKTIGAIFPRAFAHFVSLCYILVILTIFQTFLLLLYLLWWSVLSGLWCYYCNCFSLILAIKYFLIKVCPLYF